MDRRPGTGSKRRLPALAAALALIAACATTPAAVKPLSEAEIYLKRGHGYLSTGDDVRAVEEYGKAIHLSPEWADAWHYRGLARFSSGRNAEALADFDRALALDPNSAETFVSRGLLHYQAGRFAEALLDLERAIALDPWNAKAYYYKARACERVGKLREAAEAYRGYVHCSAGDEREDVEKARRRIEELERPAP